MKKSVTKSNVSLTATNNQEATMVKILVNDSMVFVLEKFNSRVLYKFLRDTGFLPAESVGKTSSEATEDGKGLLVSFKDIEVTVDVEFDYVVEAEETFAVADPAKKAAASVSSYGLSTNFGILAKKEIFFMEKDEETGKSKMSGAEVHTGEYLSQLDKKEKKRAAQLAKSKEFYNLAIVSELKKLDVDVASLDKEVLALIAEQTLDLEKAPNAYLYNDSQDLVKVQVQRYNEKTGRWYNAKNRNGSPMVEFFPAEDLFEYDQDGRIVGMKMTEFGQTALANTVENDYDLICVHNYQYIDKETNELVFKSIDQRFIVSGYVVNSSAVIDGHQLEATMGISNWAMNITKSKGKIIHQEVVKSFQFFGHDNLVDIGEGFYLMPSVDEVTGVDMQEAEFSDGIQTGTSVGTSAMATNQQAKDHIKAKREEEAELKKVALQARRNAQSKVDSKEYKLGLIRSSGLYQWALENQQLTFDARKNAKLQNDLNTKFQEMKDQCDDLLEVLALLKLETGRGFAHPSWIVINSLAKKPKRDSDKKANEVFASKVKKHIVENIAAINAGDLKVKGMDPELAAEIVAVCRASKGALTIKHKPTFFALADLAQTVRPVAQSVAKPRNGKVVEVDVADYCMSNKVS
jgi:hypothetical protein